MTLGITQRSGSLFSRGEACTKIIDVERERKDVVVNQERCPYCHSAVEKGVAPKVCADCHALQHASCFEEHGACAACGWTEASQGAPRAEKNVKMDS